MKVKKMIKKMLINLFYNRVIRYIFFGGLTTLVNVFSFFVLRRFIHIELNTANVISITLAIIFAYLVNSKYVFESGKTKLQKFKEFIKFFGARISTMIIEVAGVYILSELLNLNDMFSKIIIQFIVLVLNYIFSKFFVFNALINE